MLLLWHRRERHCRLFWLVVSKAEFSSEERNGLSSNAFPSQSFVLFLNGCRNDTPEYDALLGISSRLAWINILQTVQTSWKKIISSEVRKQRRSPLQWNKQRCFLIPLFFFSFFFIWNQLLPVNILFNFPSPFCIFHFTEVCLIQKISESGSSDGKNDTSYLLLKTITASVLAVTATEAPPVTGLYHCEVPRSLSGDNRCHLAPWCCLLLAGNLNLPLCLLNCFEDLRERSLIQIMCCVWNVSLFEVPIFYCYCY